MDQPKTQIFYRIFTFTSRESVNDMIMCFYFNYIYFLPSHRVSESAVGQTVACNWLSLSHSFKKTRHKPSIIL